MGEKELKDELSIDWESESKHYRKLYDELVQSSQNKEETDYIGQISIKAKLICQKTKVCY